jgi:uncharacterized protein YbaR (Trm112 family)
MFIPADLLRCPATGEKLRSEGNTLTSNGHVYPVVNGVPVLIDADLSVFSADEVAQQRHVEKSVSPFRSLVRRLVPTRTYSLGQRDRYEAFVRFVRSIGGKRVLVIGGGSLGSGATPLIESELEVIESDVYLSPRVDIVCDGHNLPFPSESLDGIVLQAVLEHVLDPPKVVAEAYRVLRRQGVLYAETPFLQAVHEGAFDFTRWTELGHRRLFRMFSELDRGVVAGPATSLLWALCYFARSIPRGRGTAPLLLEKLVMVLFFWLKYFDRWLITHEGATDAASGVYFMGQKSDAPLPDAELLASYRGTVGRPIRRS